MLGTKGNLKKQNFFFFISFSEILQQHMFYTVEPEISEELRNVITGAGLLQDGGATSENRKQRGYNKHTKKEK